LLQVTLWNTGEDAFQHSTYGDWLTIERVIKTAGGTQYKILNSAGRKVGASGHEGQTAVYISEDVGRLKPFAAVLHARP
jgi:hypothetical protein